MKNEEDTIDLYISLTHKKQMIDIMIDNFKAAFFNLTYILIKHQRENYLIQIMSIVIQFVEIMAFPFNSIFEEYWKHSHFMMLSNFFQYFQLVDILKDNTAFYIITYMITAIVIIVFLSFIVFVMVRLYQYKLNALWAIKLLDFFFSIECLIVLPVAKIFISVFNCQEGSVYYAKGIQCYSGLHMTLMIISSILLVIFGIFSVLIHLVYFEFRDKKQNPYGKLTSRTDIELLIVKGVLLILYELLYSYKELLICINIICALFLLWDYFLYEPYYNEIINMLYFLMYYLLFWASAVPFLSFLLNYTTEYNGSIPLFLLGCPLILAGQWIKRNKRVELNYLLLSLSKINNAYIALKQIKYFKSLIEKQEFDNFHKEQIFIAGYIKHYELSCNDSNCALKKYLNTPRNNFRDGRIFLLQHVEILFKNAISRFPTDVKLRLSFGIFLYERLNKKQKGIIEIINAEKYDPTFEEEFLLYKCKKIFDDEIEITSFDDNVDYVSTLAYKGYLTSFKSAINRVVILYIDFWALLYINDDTKSENFAKMSDLGNKINKLVEDINQDLVKMEKINPNDPEVLKIYSQFLSEILNDQVKSTVYLSRFTEIEDNKHKYDEKNLLSLNFKALTKSEEYKYIVVSAQHDNFGVITNLSLNVCSLFGFSRNELVGQTLDLIMPEMYHADHKKLLQNKYNDYKKIGLGTKRETTENFDGNNQSNRHLKEVKTCGKNKTKYLVSLKLKTGIASTEDGEFFFIAKINEESMVNRDEGHNQTCSILTDNKFIIQNFSTASVKLLNLNSNSINNSIDITISIKELHEEFHKQAINLDEQMTSDKRKLLKKHIINKKYRMPYEITWLDGSNPALYMGSFRFKSTKYNRPESNESYIGAYEEYRPAGKLTGKNISLLTKSIKREDKLFLSVEDVTILSRQIGYLFKFETLNHYARNKCKTNSSVITSMKLGATGSQRFESSSFHNITIQDGVSPKNPHNPFGSNPNTGLKETLVGQNQINHFMTNLTSEYIPEVGAKFNIDVSNLAYKQNIDKTIDLHGELKALAVKKVNGNKAGELNQSNNSEDNSEELYESSSNIGRSNSDVSSDPTSFANNIPSSQRITQSISPKKTQINDTYYHVDMSHIIFYMYDFSKGGGTEQKENTGGQVELKIKEKGDGDEDSVEEYIIPQVVDPKHKTPVKSSGIKKDADKADLSEKKILIKQIKQSLQNKEIQPTIINLSIASFIVFCILIGTGIICLFSFMNVKNDVNMDFRLLINAFDLHLSLAYSIFHVRELVLLANEGYHNIYDNNKDSYSANQTFSALQYFSNTSYLLTNISTMVDSLSLTCQKDYNAIPTSIDILEKELIIKNYSLPIHAAFIEQNYALFHITKLAQKDIKPLNEDIFYFIRNSINNGILNSQSQIDIFLSEFFRTTTSANRFFYILMGVCIVMNIIAYFIFAYYYEAVEKRKESYLAVFYDIGNAFILTSLCKCEKFCQRIQIENDSESRNVSLDSSGYSIDENEIASSINPTTNLLAEKNSNKKKKRNESNHQGNKIKGLIVLIILGGYVLALFITFQFCLSLFDNYINFCYYYSKFQTDYILIFVTLRELMFEPNSYALHIPAKEYLEKILYDFYSKGEKEKNKVKDYVQYMPTDFQATYFEIKNGNLCTYVNEFFQEYPNAAKNNDLLCEDFMANSTALGLDSLLSYYIEEIRTMKNVVLNYLDSLAGFEFVYNNTLYKSSFAHLIPTEIDKKKLYDEYNPFNLFNLDGHKKLVILHRFMIKKIFAVMTIQLVQSIAMSLDSNALAIYIAIYVMIGLMGVIYLTIWIPFQLNLNDTIYKTKNMLSIIPKEVLASLNHIKQMLDIDKSLTQDMKVHGK